MNTTKSWKHSSKNSKAASSESAQEKALNLFAETMIEKIESIQQDWKKPWFTDSSMRWPRNLDGRNYSGMNSLMLIMHCEKQGYKYPIFCTFDKVSALNYSRTKDGLKPLKDADGNKLHVNISNYGIEGERTTEWFIDNVKIYHRKFSNSKNQSRCRKI